MSGNPVDQDDLAEFEDMKLLEGSSSLMTYCFRSIHQVKDQYGNDVILVNIRNHYDAISWTGDWGKGSHKWTDEIMNQVSYREDDGTFWMASSDLKTYFRLFHGCHYNPRQDEVTAAEQVSVQDYAIFTVFIPENAGENETFYFSSTLK